MTDDFDNGRPLNPTALALADVARILSASGRKAITVETLQKDIDAGAPVNPNGTMNLVSYAAWIVKDMGRGD
jgi:hypothetical protein